MGATVCGAVHADPDLELVAAVDPHHAGIDLDQLGLRGTGLQISARATALVDAAAEVAIDFTVIDAARENLRFCAEQGIHAVVGTTGFDDAELDELAACFAESRANAVIAPNFAIGAVLMMRFAELAAPYFETAEIIELHHDQKIDAPSGTAVLTAKRMAAASKRLGATTPRPRRRRGRARRDGRRHLGALGADARHGRAPRSAARDDRSEPEHPPRRVRPLVVHARRAARGQAGRVVSRPHDRPGRAPRRVSSSASSFGACHDAEAVAFARATRDSRGGGRCRRRSD